MDKYTDSGSDAASMPPGDDAWDIAKSRYLSTLTSEEERKLFETATPQSIFDDASQLDNEHRENSNMRKVIGKIQPLVSAIEDYGEAMDVLVNIQPLPLAPIWGSIRVVLNVAAKFGGYYERIVDLFADVGKLLPRFEDYQRMFPSALHERLTKAIADTYVDIINLCAEIRKSLDQTSKKASFKRMFKPLFRNKLSETAMSQFKQHVKLVNEEAQHSHMLQIEAARAIILREQQIKKADEEAQRRLRILAMLSNIDYVGRQRKLSKLRHEGTGIWLRSSPDYQAWQSKNAVLCCYGIPGSGKSVLISSIVENLVSARQNVAYYYCDYADKRTLTAAMIFATLTQQLLLQGAELTDQILAQIESSCKDRALDVVEMFQLLETAIRLHLKAPVLVIDGVDEMAESEQKILMEYIKKLDSVQLLLASREDLTPTLKTALQTYRIHVSRSAISVDIENFIRFSVQDLIEREELVVKDKGLQNAITAALIDGARGMFLWVHFQLQDLCEAETDSQIVDILEHLPKDLSETYDRLLGRITGTERQELVQRMFKWVVFARRPLRLDELSEAIAFTIDDEFWDASKIPTDIKRLIRHCNRLLVVDDETKCVHLAHYTVQQYLLSLDDRSDTLQFGATDASRLLGEVCVAYLCFNDFETQLVRLDDKRIAKSTLSTLSRVTPDQLVVGSAFQTPARIVSKLRSFTSSPNCDLSRHIVQGPALSNLEEKYCLLSYITENWVWHALEHVPQSSSRLMRLLRLLIQDKSLLFPFRPWKEPDEEIIWALENNCFGLLNPETRECLGLSQDVFQFLEKVAIWFYGQTNAHYGVLYAELLALLDPSIPIRTSTLKLNKYTRILARGLVSIIGHCSRGTPELVSILAPSKLVFPFAKALRGHMVSEAAAYGHNFLVTAFLPITANEDLIRSSDYIFNEAAGYPRHPAVAPEYLRVYYIIDAISLNAIERAAAGGHSQTVVLLWDSLHRAEQWLNIEPRKAYFRDKPSFEHFLLPAIENSQPDVVESLLLVASLHGRQQALLSAQEASDSSTIVRTDSSSRLFETVSSVSQAILQVPDTDKIPFLNLAVQTRCDLSIGTFSRSYPFDKPADQSLYERYFLSTYCGSESSSSCSGYLNVFKQLVNASTDINEEDFWSDTPLYSLSSITEKGGQLPLSTLIDSIDLLLQAGADPNKTSLGSSPLYVACQQKNPHVVEKLITYGADVNLSLVKDGRPVGASPLQMAASKGAIDILDQLIEAGADINYQSPASSSAILFSASEGLYDVVDRLLKAGVSFDIPELMGKTPFWQACRQGKHNVARLLQQAGANPFVVDNDGFNCFALSCRTGDVRLVAWYLEVGPDGLRRGHMFFNVACNGLTPFDYAVTNKQKEVLRLMESTLPTQTWHVLTQEGQQYMRQLNRAARR